MEEKEIYVIAGLGNPGPAYERTRHNCGFEVLDRLSRTLDLPIRKSLCKALVGEGRMGDARLILVKPQTFMNLSGESLSEIVRWYHVPLDHLLVIYDDIDLAPGRLRMRKSGSAGTHNGMRSVVACLGDQSFPRLRVGVGSRPEAWELADWVLSKPSTKEEQDVMDLAFALAADGAVTWVREGLEKAMQLCNASHAS